MWVLQRDKEEKNTEKLIVTSHSGKLHFWLVIAIWTFISIFAGGVAWIIFG